MLKKYVVWLLVLSIFYAPLALADDLSQAPVNPDFLKFIQQRQADRALVK